MTDLIRAFSSYLHNTAADPKARRLRFTSETQNWIVQTLCFICAEKRIEVRTDITVSVVQSWILEKATQCPDISHARLLGLLHAISGFLAQSVKDGLLTRNPAPNLVLAVKIPDSLKSPIEHRLDRFYVEKVTFKGNTADTLRWFKGFFPMFLRDCALRDEREITKLLVQNWLSDGTILRGWSHKTVRNYLQILNLFLDWCVETGGLSLNPATSISKPRLPKPIPRSLSRDQAQTVLDMVRDMPYAYLFDKVRSHAIIATFLFTGLRLSELRNLNIEDVLLEGEKPLLIVRKGKGKKDRQIPLQSEHRLILQDYMKERKRLERCCQAFFCGLRHDQRIGIKSIPRLFKRLSERLPFHFTPHMLRHTCATLLMEAGCSTREMQELLGHASVTTTERYTHVTPDHLRTSVARHPLFKSQENKNISSLPEANPMVLQAIQILSERGLLGNKSDYRH